MCRGVQDLDRSGVGCVGLDDGSKFGLVDRFCYLGDMLCAGGGQKRLLELECGQLGEAGVWWAGTGFGRRGVSLGLV